MIVDKLKRYVLGLEDYDVQINVSKARTCSVEFKENRITSVLPEEEVESDIIVYDKEGRLSSLSSDGVLSVDNLKRAIKMNKIGLKDNDYKCLPTGGRYNRVSGIFDKGIEKIINNHDFNYIAGKADEVINSCLGFNPKIERVHGGLTYIMEKEEIFNSNGVDCSSEKTLCGISLAIESLDGDKNGLGMGSQYQRNIRDLDTELVTEKAAGLSLDLLGAGKMEVGDVPVVLTSGSFNRMIINSIRELTAGGNIRTGKSCLAGKLGSKIGGENFTVIDNPHVYKGNGSRAFDSEGVPTRKRAIIEKGVLKTYLLDWYSAQKMGMEAFGFGDGLRNIQIPATNLAGEMLNLKEYVVLDYFSKGANIDTGNINGMSTGMRYYKNGECTPLKGINVASNVIDIIENIADISEPDPLVGAGNRIPEAVLVKKGVIKFS